VSKGDIIFAIIVVALGILALGMMIGHAIGKMSAERDIANRARWYPSSPKHIHGGTFVVAPYDANHVLTEEEYERLLLVERKFDAMMEALEAFEDEEE